MSNMDRSSSGEKRIEKDSMGEVRVPADALWGASTQRAVENFPIAGRGVPGPVIHGLGSVKAACAAANRGLDRLEPAIADAIVAAAGRVARGELDDHFPVDVYQTGSGTSTNTNANEVIARLASEACGQAVHPNDHVNRGQSSNDVFPTAMHVAAVLTLEGELLPALERLRGALGDLAERWGDVIKVGRTHLMDATPVRFGQVFAGYASQLDEAGREIGRAAERLAVSLPIGGTAVGTGINTHPAFGARVAGELTQALNRSFAEAANHAAVHGARDHYVAAHASLRGLALSLSKLASDVRLMGSGPRCGLGELKLPAIQPGSSIMAGKVNPVLCESVMQAACRVMGNDVAVSTANLGGVGSILELNVAMPVMADGMHESIRLLTQVMTLFREKVLQGLAPDEQRCAELLDRSLMVATALIPSIGYDKTAALVKRALSEGRTVRELVLEEQLIDEAELTSLLDPAKMTGPSR